MKFFVNKNTGAFCVSCCGAIADPDYTELKANDTDAALEKHVPVVMAGKGAVTVEVGAVPHPMTEAHLISVIVLETNKGYQLRKLAYTDEPKAVFALADGETAVAAYEYCNLHGLWTAKVQ